jgi:hypothetical protein
MGCQPRGSPRCVSARLAGLHQHRGAEARIPCKVFHCVTANRCSLRIEQIVDFLGFATLRRLATYNHPPLCEVNLLPKLCHYIPLRAVCTNQGRRSELCTGDRGYSSCSAGGLACFPRGRKAAGSTRSPLNFTPSSRSLARCSFADAPEVLVVPSAPSTRCHGN